MSRAALHRLNQQLLRLRDASELGIENSSCVLVEVRDDGRCGYNNEGVDMTM